MEFAGLGVIGFMVLNLMSVFSRQSRWFRSIYKWYVAIFLFLVGILLLVFSKIEDVDTKLFYFSLTTPAILSLIDYMFGWISVSIQQRDFYLWLRGSDDLSDKNIVFRASDKILSILLLYISGALTFLPLFILKH